MAGFFVYILFFHENKTAWVGNLNLAIGGGGGGGRILSCDVTTKQVAQIARIFTVFYFI